MTDIKDPKHYVVQQLRDALATDDRVNELHIRVTVAGDKVFIAGSVPTHERHEAITIVAQEVLPDYQIFNETTVEGVTGPPKVEDVT